MVSDRRRRFLRIADEVVGCVLAFDSEEVGECAGAPTSSGRGLRLDNARWRRRLVYWD